MESIKHNIDTKGNDTSLSWLEYGVQCGDFEIK